MRRATVRLPDDLDARVRREARRRGVAAAAVLREAIEAHLARWRLRCFGAGRSGRADISERVEEILAGNA